jgi:DNA polymerase
VRVPLSHPCDVAGFQAQASRLLAQRVPPEDLQWSAPPSTGTSEQPLAQEHAEILHRAARAIVPQSFMRMTELVVLHRDEDRFDLLYGALWRLVNEPESGRLRLEADLARLRRMAQAVRRDIHRMKARLAFRPLPVHGVATSVAWYEPAHYTCELVGAWLVQHGPAAPWILLTPERSLRWDGVRLLGAPAVVPPARDAGDAGDAGWARALEALPWA